MRRALIGLMTLLFGCSFQALSALPQSCEETASCPPLAPTGPTGDTGVTGVNSTTGTTLVPPVITAIIGNGPSGVVVSGLVISGERLYAASSASLEAGTSTLVLSVTHVDDTRLDASLPPEIDTLVPGTSPVDFVLRVDNGEAAATHPLTLRRGASGTPGDNGVASAGMGVNVAANGSVSINAGNGLGFDANGDLAMGPVYRGDFEVTGTLGVQATARDALIVRQMQPYGTARLVFGTDKTADVWLFEGRPSNTPSNSSLELRVNNTLVLRTTGESAVEMPRAKLPLYRPTDVVQNTGSEFTINCNAGDIVVSGGCSTTNVSRLIVVNAPKSDLSGWRCDFDGADASNTAYAVCMKR